MGTAVHIKYVSVGITFLIFFKIFLSTHMAQVFPQHWYAPSMVQNYIKQTNTSRSRDIS